MRFVHGREIVNEVKQLVAQKGDVMAAVAFWGKGAVGHTGISRKENGRVRVLCDLFSGACNPDEIRELLDRRGIVTVKALTGMHAKVWVNDRCAIVGSANASTNGLGFENSDSAHGNVEAAIVSSDATVVEAVRVWFMQSWHLGGARMIGIRQLDEVRDIWVRRRSQLPSSPMKDSTLLEHLESTETPKGFSKLRITAYRAGKYSSEAISYWDENKRLYYSDDDLKRLEDFPFYEVTLSSRWPRTPGTVYLDYSCSRAPGRFHFDRHFWRVRDSDPSDHHKDYGLIFLSPEPDFGGYMFPRSERARVARAVRCWVNKNGWDENPVYDFAYLNKEFVSFLTSKRRECMQRRSHEKCGDCPWA